MNSNSTPLLLTDEIFIQGLQDLCDKDPDLAQIYARLDPPSFWARKPGFDSLVYIILEQQVSLASAKATYDRLREAITQVTPERFLILDDAGLKTIGFSRQKTAYCRNLAGAIITGDLDLDGLVGADDKIVRAELTRIKGIGSWTANIYLLTALCRPDIWPKEDLALAVAVQEVKGLPARPTPKELDQLGAYWRPWRSVAARLLWNYYRGKGPRRPDKK